MSSHTVTTDNSYKPFTKEEVRLARESRIEGYRIAAEKRVPALYNLMWRTQEAWIRHAKTRSHKSSIVPSTESAWEASYMSFARSFAIDAEEAARGRHVRSCECDFCVVLYGIWSPPSL